MKTSRHRQNGLSYVPKKILTWMLREARGGLKATAGDRVTTRLSLSPHSFLFLFDSRIVRRTVCESMPSRVQKLLQWVVALENQHAIRAVCQGHTDEDMLTIHHSSNQPFTAIKIP